jgi:hypothetical protein
MDEFIKTLTEEQKQALLKALSGGSFEPEVSDKPVTDDARWLHEEPVSEAVDGDFSMKKNIKPRRSIVQAGENTWVDEGEDRHIKTPEIKRTPRNRSAPKMREVKCSACGKVSKINAGLVFGEYYRCERCIGG